MYFLDRFTTDNLFSLNFDGLDLNPSFKAMDLALAAPRFTEFAPVQVIMPEAAEASEPSEDSVAPDDGVNAPAPPGPLFAVINGTANDDNLVGTASPDTINGLAGNDTINGLGGADTINGGDGDDYIILEAGDGSDDFFGGNGSDTIDLTDFTSGLNYDLAAGTYQFGTANSIENVRAGSGNDDIDGSSAANDLRGNGGNDTINGFGGNDTLRDGAGNDIVNGGFGNDTFIMGTGADTLNGDAGNDIFNYVSAGFDTANVTDIDGGSGNDEFSFSTFNSDYSINLTTGEMRRLSDNLLLVTLTSVEIARAGNGDDILQGGSDLFGGGGNDTLIYIDGTGFDNFDGGTGIDTMDFSGDNGIITVNLETEVYNGGRDMISIENFIGSTGNDDITGSTADNIIEGGIGADTMDGAGGMDTLSYESSLAGVTIDLVVGSALGGDAAGDIISNFENISGSAFDDSLRGVNSVSNVLSGNDGNDTLIFGGTAADEAYGGNGDDTLRIETFATGHDGHVIDGGNGTDTFTFFTFGSSYSVDLGAGTFNNLAGTGNASTLVSIENITAGGGDDVLTGDSGDNIIDGGGGNDTLNGTSGEDTINAGDGDDTVIDNTFWDVTGESDVYDGGAGIDTLVYTGFGTTSVVVNLLDGEVTVAGSARDLISNFENVTVAGSVGIVGDAGDNVLTGGTGTNTIEGGDGADTLDGGAGIDTLSYAGSDAGVSVDLGSNIAVGSHADGDVISNFENLIGSAFGDQLEGTIGDNVISGGGGNDLINGDSGNDTLNGGDGTDTLNGGAGNDVLNGGLGNDILNGDAGNDTLNGGAGNDTIRSGSGDDIVNGGDGDDVLLPGSTASPNISAGDIYDGGAGIDTLDISSVTSGTNPWTVNLATGELSFVGSVINASLVNIENIEGSQVHDILTGDANDNVINGNGGNDTIDAGGGTNTVDGGAGNDTIASSGDGTYLGGSGNDYMSAAGTSGSFEILDGGAGIDTLDLTSPSIPYTLDMTTGVTNYTGGFGESFINFENVIMGNGTNNVTGTSGDNEMTGGTGSDTFAGLGGADTMDGGAGSDTLDYSASGAGVTVDLAANTASGGDAAGDVISNFENVDGSAFDDILTTSDLGGIFNGGDGNDMMTVTGGLNGSILQAGSGNDVLWSAVTMNSSLLNGDGGDDEIHLFTDSGLAGTGDVGNGGSGNDIIFLESEVFNQTADGEGGVDVLSLGNLTGGYIVDMNAGTVDDGDALDNATFSNIENIIGSSGADTITGDGLSNEIAGGLGDDIINGGDGDDILDGGFFGGSSGVTGTDTINGGAGNDVIIYSRDSTGGNDVDNNDGGTGIDTYSVTNLNFLGNTWSVDLTAGAMYFGTFGGSLRGNLTNIENVEYTSTSAFDIRGDGGANVLTSSGDSVNRIEGMAGDDIISAGDGDDSVEGGAGADNMDGGAGTDILDYNGSAAGVNVNLGTGTTSGGDAVGDTIANFENLFGSQLNDILTGDALNNFISAADGNDRLDGGAGDDILQGDFGADTLLGGAGADVNNGGDGFDSMDYRAATSRVVLNLDTGGTLGDAAGDSYSSIERVYGSDFNDTITGTDANEFFYGEDGNDTINAGGGIDRVYGGNGNDIQRGDAGNDQLYGSAGSDQLNGGTGFDIANYQFAASAVVLNLGSGGTLGDAAGDTYFGIEAVYGSDFNDILAGNNSANELRGWDGDDTLNGAGGSDRLFGGAGADALNGGTGVDIAVYTDATSGVTANLATAGTVGDAAGDTYSSIEWVWGSDFNDIITGDAGNNRLEGRDGNDTLNGGDGNDRLLGGDGDDTINGGNGVDTIFGQNGNDNLIGAGGNDFFFGSDGGDSMNGGLDFDTVSYLASTSAVGVDLQTSGFFGDANGDTYASIERVFGSQHDDYIIGSNGANTLLGNGGSDYLEGGLGNDSLFGGAATDSFGYNTTNGDADVISDFSTAGEVIYILGGDAAFDTFAEVQAVGADAGANVIFNFGGGNTLTIVGQNLADINAGDFDFTGPPPAAEMLDDPDAYASEPLTFDEIMAIHQAFAADANEMQLDDALI